MLFGSSKKVLTYKFSVPLDSTKSAELNIDTGTGNLTIDKLASSEQLLASGELQYLEGQDLPVQTLNLKNNQATLVLSASGARQPGFRFPWEACNGATQWDIHLNPKVSSNIIAHSGGGNIKLNLSGMIIVGVAADTGGGNIDLILPDEAKNLNVTSKTGAGNVTVEVGSLTGNSSITATSGAGNVVVRIPRGVAAKINATSGLGKVIIDSQFSKIDKNTYQSSDFNSAANKVEITIKSGAGNVSVNHQ